MAATRYNIVCYGDICLEGFCGHISERSTAGWVARTAQSAQFGENVQLKEAGYAFAEWVRRPTSAIEESACPYLTYWMKCGERLSAPIARLVTHGVGTFN